MRRGESSLCGSLMTHKVPHKLPHKTDVGFLEPIPHGGGVHENARKCTHFRSKFYQMQKRTQKAPSCPCKGVGL